MDLYHALERLCNQASPSGFEGPAAQAAKDLLEPLVDEVYIDRLGSVIGIRRCGKPTPKRLLLDAHLDEIGLIVTGIEEGFLRFAPIGGVDPRMLPDRLKRRFLSAPQLFIERAASVWQGIWSAANLWMTEPVLPSCFERRNC